MIVFSDGRLRAVTTALAPRSTLVWSDPQAQRVHMVTPEGVGWTDTVETGSSSGQPQNGQRSIGRSSSQDVWKHESEAESVPAVINGRASFRRPTRRWQPEFAKLIVK